jgi:hypothetical protein
MKLENQSRKNNRNMTTNSMSKVSNKVTPYASSEVTEWVVNLLSSVLEEDDISSVRAVLFENRVKLQNIISDSQVTQKSSSSKKNVKDPLAPKRGKTSYIFFCVKKRNEIKESYPDMSAKEIIKELGKVWRSLSDDEKETYVNMSVKDRNRYEEEISNYVAPTNIGFLNPKKTKRSGPKRGLTAYIYFCKDHRDTLKEEQPELSTKEITTGLGKKWKELTDDEKVPFVKLAANDKTRYEKEKETYVDSEHISVEDKKTNDVKSKPNDKKSSKKTNDVKSKPNDKKSSKKKISHKKSGYILYCQEQRVEVKNDNPSWSSQQVTKELGKTWKALSDEKQVGYNERASGENE